MSHLNLVQKGYDFRISEDPLPPSQSQSKSQVALTSPEESKNSNDKVHLTKTLLTAPKGKPRAPPLIHERVKLEAAEVNHNHLQNSDAKDNDASAIPLKKSKSSSSEFKNDLPVTKCPGHGPGSVSGTSTGSRSARSKDSSRTGVGSTGKPVEKVKVSKGIEMKRVVQDASRVKPKVAPLTSSTKVSVTASVTATKHKKMTKTVTLCPEVKVKRYLEDREGSGSKVNVNHVAGQSTTIAKSVTVTVVDPANAPKKDDNDEMKTAVSDTVAAATEAGAGASLEEFLKMPETNLPETQSQPNASTSGSKKLYKSKFWEYLNPNAKSNDSKKKEQKKPYNADEVKSFMQKQKEARRLQQMKQSKEKQEEHEKRIRSLKELESKYQRQRAHVAKEKDSKKTSTSTTGTTTTIRPPPIHDGSQSPPKRSRLDSESPSLKYLKPLLERKSGGFLRKSDSRSETAKQAQYLLSEFESIVKRECMSFIQQIPKAQQTPSSNEVDIDSPQSVTKVDKAVGTNGTDDEVEKEKLFTDLKRKRFSSPSVERAAMKIQALYRGYKVRKALKEAKINLRKSFYFNFEKSSITPTSSSSRRWSLPAPSPAPEKPYTNSSKLQPMSPIPIPTLKGPAFNPAHIPCYIPPPSPAPPTQRQLPPFAITPVRLRSFDEPYPNRPQTPTHLPFQIHPRNSLTSVGVGTNFDQVPSSSSRRLSAPPSAANFSLTRIVESLSLPQSQSQSSAMTRNSLQNLNYSVPSAALPSVLDAFREKLNLFKSQIQQNVSQDSIELKRTSSMDELQIVRKTSSMTSSVHNNGPATYTTDFESISDTNTKLELRSTVSEEIVETPKIKKSSHRTRSNSHHRHKSPTPNTSTTAETEEDYISSHSRSQPPEVTHSSSEKTLTSSSELPIPTASNSLGGLVAPALRLRYEAERERLLVLEKALHVPLTARNKDTPKSKLNHNHVSPSTSQQRPESTTSIHAHKERLKSSESVQYAIAKVQKESMRAAAEMAKWMAEFQRNTQQLEKLQTQKSSADLEAIVYKAVEEVVGEEKRNRRRKLEKQESTSTELKSSQSREEIEEKEDKSVQTSLPLPRMETKVEREEQCKPEVQDQAVEVPEEWKEQSYNQIEEESVKSTEVECEDIGSLSVSLSSRKVAEELPADIPDDEFYSEGDLTPTPTQDGSGKRMEVEVETDSVSVSLDKSKSLIEEKDISDVAVEKLGEESHSTDEQNQNHSQSHAESEKEKIENVSLSSREVTKEVPVDMPNDDFHSERDLSPTQTQNDSGRKVEVETDSVSKCLDNSMSIKDGKGISEVPVEIPGEESYSMEEHSQNQSRSKQSQNESGKIGDVDSHDLDSISVFLSSRKVIEEKSVEEPGGGFVQNLSPPTQDGSEWREEFEVETDSVVVSLEKSKSLKEEEEDISVVVVATYVSNENEESHSMEGHNQSHEESGKIQEVECKDLNSISSTSNNCKVTEEPLTDEFIPEGQDLSIIPTQDGSGGMEEVESEPEGASLEKSKSLKEEKDVSVVVVEVPQEELQSLDGSNQSHSLISQSHEESEKKSLQVECENEGSLLDSFHGHKVTKDVFPDVPDEELFPQDGSESREKVDVETDSGSVSLDNSYSLKNEKFSLEATGIPAEEIQSIEDHNQSHKSQSQSNEESGKRMEVEVEDDSVSASLEQSKPLKEEKAVEIRISPEKDAPKPVAEPDVPVFTSRLQNKLLEQPPPHHPSDVEIPLKPPPPYSPSSSLDSASISSRSLMISLPKDKLELIVTEQVDKMWDAWTSHSRRLPSLFDILQAKQVQYSCAVNDNTTSEGISTAIENFDNLLWHLVYDTIRESLQGENHSLSLIERARPGPLAIQAQSLRVPKTKDILRSQVLEKILKTVPATFFRDVDPEDLQVSTQLPRSKKWCSRSRELVDEILLEELERENYQWTEWWPEEKIIIQNATNNIIRSLVKNALEKRNYVYDQGWGKCFNFKYDVIRN